MVFSVKLLLFGLGYCLFLLIPSFVYAQTYTVDVKNQTVTINIKPSDVMVKPNNTIIVEPQNTTKLEKLIQTLADKPDEEWHKGDLIIASSTIVAFFSFGSFLIIRFKSKKRDKDKVSMYLDIVLLGTWAIQILHLSVIVQVIIGNAPNDNGFIIAYVITMIFLSMIGWYIRRIIRVENNLDKIRTNKDEISREFLEYLGKKYDIDSHEIQSSMDEYTVKNLRKTATKKDDHKEKRVENNNDVDDDDEI